MDLWERIVQLPSVREWCSNILSEDAPKVFWIRSPGWFFVWSQDIAEILTSFLIHEREEIPLVLRIDSNLDEKVLPLEIVRREIAAGDEVEDTESLVQHVKAPQFLLVCFEPLSPTLQEIWANWFVRWIRLASQFDLPRQVFVLAPFRVPPQAIRQNEQFLVEIEWMPSYSHLEAQALIEAISNLRVRDLFEKHWTVYLLTSMCGQDIYCAREALVQASDLADLGEVDFWKHFLALYATEHFQDLQPGDVISALGLREAHPVDLLKSHASIGRRIWRGQLWWLMYYVDEIRWAAQQKLSGIPPSVNGCEDWCKEDRGELKCLICVAKRTGDSKLSHLIEQVRAIRNDLAHYRPIHFSQARRLWEILNALIT